METRAFVDPSGRYLISFIDDDTPSPQPDAIPVPSAPFNALQTWNFDKQEWNPLEEEASTK